MKTVQTMKGHGNYQNCSVLRPHASHSSYGTYVTLAPKVLVFPVFVQVSRWLALRSSAGDEDKGGSFTPGLKDGASLHTEGPLWGKDK